MLNFFSGGMKFRNLRGVSFVIFIMLKGSFSTGFQSLLRHANQSKRYIFCLRTARKHALSRNSHKIILSSLRYSSW